MYDDCICRGIEVYGEDSPLVKQWKENREKLEGTSNKEVCVVC